METSMIQQVKAAVQKFRDLPEDSPVKTTIRSGKSLAIAQYQKFMALPKRTKQNVAVCVRVGWMVLAAIGLAIPDKPATLPAGEVAQGGRRSLMTNQGYIGAWSEADLDLVIRAARQNDTDAVASLMVSDRAFWIPANRTVEVDGSSGFFGSRVKARFVGESRYFYTVSEAIH